MPLRPDLPDLIRAGRQPTSQETLDRLGWASADGSKLSDELGAIARQAMDDYDQTPAGQDRLYNPDTIPNNLSPETKTLCENLNLVGQYHDQVEVLTEAGLLSPEHEMTAIDGKVYPIPTIEQIARRIETHRTTYETKLEQGFSQLLLVPFGMSLDTMIQSYGDQLQAVSRAGELVDSTGEHQELDTATPVWVWDELAGSDKSGAMVYYPKTLSSEPSEHGGKTKAELVDSGTAWEVMLVEDMVDIPASGVGKLVAGRHQLEAGSSPRQYLERLSDESAYSAESGLTVEAWLSLALTRLQATHQVLDSYQADGKAGYLLGSWLPASCRVTTAYWARADVQADLVRDEAGNVRVDCGVRSAVRVLDT